MTNAQIVARLKPWATRHRELKLQVDALRALTGAELESPLLAAIWSVWGAYTVAVSELIGDRAEWLQWYELECDMGTHPMGVRSTGGRVIKVKTLHQLATVIHDRSEG